VDGWPLVGGESGADAPKQNGGVRFHRHRRQHATLGARKGGKTHISPRSKLKYDPFVRGEFPVGVRTIELPDQVRNRLFPCEIWYPAAAQHFGEDVAHETQDVFTVRLRSAPRRQMAVRDAAPRPGTYPLVVFSHSSGGQRRASTFLCTHLSSHGYVAAALDHSEVVAKELAPKCNETAEQKAARAEAWIANRVPDLRLLIDRLLGGAALPSEIHVDPKRVGAVGHSFGGWTVLAATAEERRIGAVVALAPGGSSQLKPGMLPLTLTFGWDRDVPTLYLVAEDDISIPLAAVHELFERTPATKQLAVLRRADHLHFIDDVEQEHEAVRAMSFPAELAWIQKEMRPIAELSSGEEAHVFVRGLTLCHMDATLKRQSQAQRFLHRDVQAELAAKGVDARVESVKAMVL
jgi:dienelactone hydrolase